MLAAAEAGAAILREGGSALDAVIAAVVAFEDHPLFNAGYGSMLNAAGKIEMDAGVMVAERAARSAARSGAITGIAAGAVAAVSRVRNPILLARAVMERTPHILMVGSGAESLARAAGIPRCAPGDLITPRALARWRKLKNFAPSSRGERPHGTVGAVAVDSRGALAAATSTGGYSRKLAGRIGDSPILGAGFFADHRGAASATGLGEAIITLGLCRAAVMALGRATASACAAQEIASISRMPRADAGIIVIDRTGDIGYAHNAASMEVAMFGRERGLRYELVKPRRA